MEGKIRAAIYVRVSTASKTQQPDAATSFPKFKNSPDASSSSSADGICFVFTLIEQVVQRKAGRA